MTEEDVKLVLCGLYDRIGSWSPPSLHLSASPSSL